jgi:hypothetical protein
MKAPEPRTVFMSVALIGIGSLTGAFLDRISFPRVAQLFTTCASSKQFVVEFRIRDWLRPWGERIPGLLADPVLADDATMEVDGIHIGELGEYRPLRHFLCEGNHRARMSFSVGPHLRQVHVIDFAVARPSLFHVTQQLSSDSETCAGDEPCNRTLFFELSAYEPDDLKVRIYPQEAGQ